MNVTFEKGDLTITAKVTFGIEEVNPIFDRVVKQISAGGRVNGFRKGKIPTNILLSHFGANISNKAGEQLANNAYKFLADKEELKNRVGYPSLRFITEISRDKEAVLEVVYQAFPEVELKPLNEISFEQVTSYVSDQDMDDMLKFLCEQRGAYRNIDDGVAEEGCKITISFEGKIDGVPFEDGKADNYELLLNGDSGMIAGFADQIKGHKVGDSFQINATFPENYKAEELSGKPVVFDCTLKTVSVFEPCSLDTLAKALRADNAEELRSRMKQNMEYYGRRIASSVTWDNFVEAVIAANGKIKLPQISYDYAKAQLVEERVTEFFNAVGFAPHKNKKEFKEFVKATREGIAEEVSQEDIEHQALNQFYVSLYSQQIPLDPQSDEMKAAVDKYIDDMSISFDDPEEFKTEVRADEKQMDAIRKTVFNDEFTKALYANAAHEEKSLSFSELQKLNKHISELF